MISVFLGECRLFLRLTRTILIQSLLKLTDDLEWTLDCGLRSEETPGQGQTGLVPLQFPFLWYPLHALCIILDISLSLTMPLFSLLYESVDIHFKKYYILQKPNKGTLTWFIIQR